MQSRTFYLTLVMIFVIFTGCSTTPPPSAQTKTVPAWIHSPLPHDTNSSIYGMSIAEDRESAIKSALADMVAKLGTTIESSYESSTEVRGGFVNANTKHNLKTSISKININNYKIIKSHKISYREFAVMLESDKQQLLQGLKQNLVTEQDAIMQKYNTLKGEDALHRYNIKKELSTKANALLSDIFIIATLDKNFDTQENINFIDTKQNQFVEEAKNLKFHVSGDIKSTKFVSAIINHLAFNGFYVTNSDYAIGIKVTTQENIITQNEIQIAVITIEIGVYDNDKRIGGKSILLKERYNGSSETLYKNASIHLEQDIKAKGLSETIGINLQID